MVNDQERKDVVDVTPEVISEKGGPDIEERSLEPKEHSLPPTVIPKFEIQADERKRRITEFTTFVKAELKEGEDYGTIPGVKKPSLWQPGADKINNFCALFPHYSTIESTRDFRGGFFDYWTKCVLYKVVFFDGKATEVQVGEGEGTCNSYENKYRFRWEFKSNIPEGVDHTTLQTKVVKNKSGATFTMYRVENQDPCALDNTIRKMSMKRALLKATLTANPGASVLFTQDLEDNAKQGSKEKKEPKKEFRSTEKTEQKEPEDLPGPGGEGTGMDEDGTYATASERPALNKKLIHLKEKVGDDDYKEAIDILFEGRTKLTTEEVKILVKHLEKLHLDMMGKQQLGT